MATDRQQPLCPSAQPEWQGARIFGVVGGTAEAPATAYLSAPQPVTEQLLQLAGSVRPGEVFRMAAPCVCHGCSHFAPEAATCRLVEKTVRWLPPVVDKLPACSIRASCRWWQQEGKAACLRCPQVVTENFKPTPAVRDAANPLLR
jgi:hypothetical protein